MVLLLMDGPPGKPAGPFLMDGPTPFPFLSLSFPLRIVLQMNLPDSGLQMNLPDSGLQIALPDGLRTTDSSSGRT